MSRTGEIFISGADVDNYLLNFCVISNSLGIGDYAKIKQIIVQMKIHTPQIIVNELKTFRIYLRQS